LSGHFFQRSLFAAFDAILGAIVTSHTHRIIMSQPKYGHIINCFWTVLIVSPFSLCRLRIRTQLRSGTVDKSKWPVFLQNASGNPTSQVYEMQNAVVFAQWKTQRLKNNVRCHCLTKNHLLNSCTWQHQWERPVS